MNSPLQNSFRIQIQSLYKFDFQDFITKLFMFRYGAENYTPPRDIKDKGADGIITKESAKEGLKLLEIDGLGLDIMDRKMLLTIIEKFNGGPVGIDTLSMAISEEKDTIEEIYEPYLLQEGFIQRTPRGRIATKLAYEHLGKDYKNIKQKSLF